MIRLGLYGLKSIFILLQSRCIVVTIFQCFCFICKCSIEDRLLVLILINIILSFIAWIFIKVISALWLILLDLKVYNRLLCLNFLFSRDEVFIIWSKSLRHKQLFMSVMIWLNSNLTSLVWVFLQFLCFRNWLGSLRSLFLLLM